MFYCDECANERCLEKTFPNKERNCEFCGEFDICHGSASDDLPELEKVNPSDFYYVLYELKGLDKELIAAQYEVFTTKFALELFLNENITNRRVLAIIKGRALATKQTVSVVE